MTSAVLRWVPEHIRGLRTTEYDALVAKGLLDGERVELLEGELVEMAPTSPDHASTVRLITFALYDQRPSGWTVRPQLPLAVPPRSEPEPDVAVVRDEDDSRRHPSWALLVVEVSRSSLVVDLEVKSLIYAAAGVPEYWVVDPDERVVHVHRVPGADGYGDVTRQRGPILTSATEPVFTLDLAAVLPR